MKKFTLLLVCLLALNAAFSQGKGNIEFFTENGEKFYIILNGIRQNPVPETNVQVTDVTEGFYRVKVIFEEENLGEVDKNFPVTAGKHTTVRVTQNRKGDYKLRFQNEVDLAQSSSDASSYAYSQEERPVSTGGNSGMTQSTNVNTDGGNMNTDVQVNESTTTTTTGSGGGENINVGMNIDGVGFNMNVSMDDGTGNTQSSTTTTTTTTSSSPSLNTSTSPNATAYQPVESSGNQAPAEDCFEPVRSQDFKRAKASIEKKSFSEDKMIVAKQVTRNNCLSVDQVIEIAELFSFEEDKLEYVKYAYPHTYNRKKYYLVNDIFTFSDSVDELNSFIEANE